MVKVQVFLCPMLQKQYPHIKLILVLPCLSQTRGWRDADIKVYERIKAVADKITYTSEEYTQGCMHKRNRHLVDHSSVCVCYLTASKGGTAYMVNYAKQQGLKVINLADKC
ncbi:SLOG family protein [Dysosmobacter sp.]|uniref:SLOG family protein n=1 Tax=Dysosmobacter sp. TaxID=2591382 RepID=UPI002A9695C3|nr:SLOG family protein [Dysosmobacter sp.]MDY5611646.1 SLOG family protein [Dysosmobacter sp.]